MKNSSLCWMIAPMLVVSVALGALPAGAAQQGAWPPLPKLTLQRCIAAKQLVDHNPFSALNNDFFVITAYDEGGDENAYAGVEKRATKNNRSPALSVYLVVRILLVEDQPVPFVHDAALMITEKKRVVHGNQKPVARSWILLDVDGDGTVDKLIFNQDFNKTEKPSYEEKIPADRKRALQGYFEQAVRRLTRKAAHPSADMCLSI
jgi:hypothetical protein